MKISYNVEVDATKKPVFPENCVVCRRPHSGQLGTIEMSPTYGSVFFISLSYYLHSLDSISSKKHVLSIPAHETCLKNVRRKFWIRNLLLILFVFAGLMLAVYNDWNRFSSFVITFILVIPLVYWQVTHPLPVEYEYYSNKYVFSFKDRNYAYIFAQLNGTTVKGDSS